MTGKHDTAHHRAKHRNKRKHHQSCLHNSICCIFAFKQTFTPFCVKNMVQNKKHEHSNAKPFVGCFPHKTVSHQEKQYHCHCNIGYNFQYLSCFHISTSNYFFKFKASFVRLFQFNLQFHGITKLVKYGQIRCDFSHSNKTSLIGTILSVKENSKRWTSRIIGNISVFKIWY